MMSQRARSSYFYNWSYDVFLNFRGQDTRNGFTGFLYDALRQKGIYTFFDDQNINRGENISASLFKAIKESRMAITVFSPNYASSAYCLDELVHILECIKGQGRLVWPIFYDVEPSQVRHQKGNYAEALTRLQESYGQEKVQMWRWALFEAANLAGLEIKQGTGYEYAYVKRIVKDVSNKINRIPLHITDHPVGLESRVLVVNSLLEVGSDMGVIMVGIVGIGGIGKTTIARAVYNLTGDKFEGLCFLSNVREISNKHGLSHLQEILLAELVEEKDIKLGGDVNRGVSIIKHRLNGKKVLLVLDDVDKQDQLHAMAGSCDWFGCGSRIIITTRDKHLLTKHGVKRKYAVNKLNDEEALQLFSWNAFGQEAVDPNYMIISKHIVHYISGLPLALEVIGSNLYGKGLDEWNSALDGYNKIPDTKIFEVLKLSYDSLGYFEKEIFLDVACFFNGYKLEYIKEMLLCRHHIKPEYAIGVLIEKSLIKIEWSVLTMHDLVQDMGKEIIRQESPKEPGGCSRLWFYKDILHVLQENTGTDKIEVLILDLPRGKEEVQWTGKAFKKMKNLQMLIIRNACFTKGPTHLPNSLRVLDWSHYPGMTLPSDFYPTNLFCLKLPSSSCVSLGPLTKKLENLTSLDFRHSKNLKQVPNLSGVTNLRELWLDDCPSLIEIHDSVGFLSKLRILSAERCINLRTLPQGIKSTYLEQLRLSWCSSLQSFPDILEKMENIKHIYLEGTAIEELPYSIQNLPGLQTLHLVECKHLKQLPTSILLLPELWDLTATTCWEFKHFNKFKGEEGEEVSSIVSSEITVLNFSKCNLSNESLSIFLSGLPNLIHLDLSFNSFTVLPACIKECHLLRDLSVENCKQLQLIEGMPPNVQKFMATNCISLTSLSLSMLLSQPFQGIGRRQITIPGLKVLEWFHLYSNGEPMHFWVRKELPTLLLGVVFGVSDDKVFKFSISIRINGTENTFCNILHLKSIALIDHTFLFELPRHLLGFEHQNLLLQDQWNHVVVSCQISSLVGLGGGVIKWSGVHLYKKENNMENIRFSKPSNPSRICHDLCTSDNDLELACCQLMKKQRTSLDMGVYDCKSPDILHQSGVATISTGCETVSNYKGKNLSANRESNHWLPPHSCWIEHPLYYLTQDSNSTEPVSASDTIGGQDGTILNHAAKSKPKDEVKRFSMSSNIEDIVEPHKNVMSKQSEYEVDAIERLCLAALKIAKHPIQLQLEPNVIGNSTITILFVTQKDVFDVVVGNDLVCISIIQVWLLYIHRLCRSRGLDDTYGFIDPMYIQNSGNKPDEIQAYIQSRICEGGKHCYLAPYYHLGHWQLMIICPIQNVVVFLCSLWYKPNKEIRSLVDVAMHAFNMLEGRNLTNRKKLTWIVPHSRKQVGSTECGYYVMRHILNIISENITDAWTEMFDNSQSFTDDEIDDIRKHIANFLLLEAKL